MDSLVTYHNVTVTDAVVHYITAGSPEHPTLLLLHGFPSSSNQFRNLIPLLAANYFIIAPDLPFFGLTIADSSLPHTFAALTAVIGDFVDALKIHSCIGYLFDYGAPILLRLALQRTEFFKAFISQSGNAYEVGLSQPFWAPIEKYWASGSEADRDALLGLLNLATTEYQYRQGVPDGHQDRVNPVAYTFDYQNNLIEPAQQQVQLDLFYDYRTNVALYPQFQEYLRKTQLPLLAVWGKGDPAFVPAGAESFKKDLPRAEINLLDGGHFLLETNVYEVADLITKFLRSLRL